MTQAARVEAAPWVQGLGTSGSTTASSAKRARVEFYLLAMAEAEAALAYPDPDLAHERMVMAGNG